MIRHARLCCGPGAMALCLAAVGCAAPPAPATQTVRVHTPGCAVARCELSNDRGRWQIARTPGSASVLVSDEALKVSCRADDGSTVGTSVAASRPGTSGVGGAVGGAAGGAAIGVALGGAALAFIPPLGVIAVLTGAAAGGMAGNAAESQSQPLRYPDSISIPMICGQAADAALPATAAPPVLGLGFRGLTRPEARALGLGDRTAVLVLDVAPEGLAAAAGLRSGDALLALDGRTLGDAADLEEQWLARSPDTPATLSLWRDGRGVDVVLTRTSKDRP